MSDIVILFTIYFLAANLVAGGIYVFGQKRLGLLWFEYPFIYMPWLAMIVMLGDFSRIPGAADAGVSLKYFLLLVQGFSCGILGGAALLARFFFAAATALDKLKVTLLSSLTVAVLFLVSRIILLEMIRWVLAMRG